MKVPPLSKIILFKVFHWSRKEKNKLRELFSYFAKQLVLFLVLSLQLAGPPL